MDKCPTVAMVATGISRRDWFATFAPTPPDWWMEHRRAREHSKAMRDDRYQERCSTDLAIDWRYEYADKMVARSEKESI